MSLNYILSSVGADTGFHPDTSAEDRAYLVAKINQGAKELHEGQDLVDWVKRLIEEGNVRRITIKNKTGKTIIEIPLTIGVVGTVLAPVLAAVGAIAALVSDCTIAVEREV